jgi:hypothetical protein
MILGYMVLVLGICVMFTCGAFALVASGALDVDRQKSVAAKQGRVNDLQQQALYKQHRAELSAPEILLRMIKGGFSGGWWTVGLVGAIAMMLYGMRLIDRSKEVSLPDMRNAEILQPEFSIGQYRLGMPAEAHIGLTKVGMLSRWFLGYGKSLTKAEAVFRAPSFIDYAGLKWKITLGVRGGYLCWIRAATGFENNKERWENGMGNVYLKVCELYGQPLTQTTAPTWKTTFGSVRMIAEETSVSGVPSTAIYGLVLEAEDDGNRPVSAVHPN